MIPSPKILDLDFVYIELYPNYIISSIKEGVVFDTPQLEAFYKIFDEYYPDKKFGYISNRINDYTVNPTCYLKSSKYPRLVGMAVCCKEESSFNTAKFEQAFYKRPFQVFYHLEECIEWVEEQLERTNLPDEALKSS